MKGDLFSSQHVVQPAVTPGMSVENAKCVKYAVNGEMYARQGAMVAYRGDLVFERKGQGVGGMLKRAVTGEGLPLMAVRGQGEAWFAHEAQNCFIVDVEPGDQFTVNGRNVLCFDASLSYEIKTVKGSGITGGGLFNSVFTGQGRLGLVCEGNPLVIPVSEQAPVYVDTDAVVGWTTHLRTSLHRSQSLGSMLRGGSGEAVQLMFQGEGFVVVRPSELTPQKSQQH
ncbi:MULTISPECIES: AIM24 family protein [Streptomyces]|uniref:AIM24 family protein n=2 Tax=Streptomyces TaxID=1883 RepID=A0ABW6Z2I6_9ACTN|nr:MULTISPECIES: AIM24 family protein [Streptomyces]MCL3997520.1 AIM24 family protein [Streptomyces lavenduligriseus]QIS69460.1 AIM24 family protein [Streptomyces sp. DSM 40868]WDM13153.1 AIM24 family protein [Streptomyces lavenduligriseus]